MQYDKNAEHTHINTNESNHSAINTTMICILHFKLSSSTTIQSMQVSLTSHCGNVCLHLRSAFGLAMTSTFYLLHLKLFL